MLLSALKYGSKIVPRGPQLITRIRFVRYSNWVEALLNNNNQQNTFNEFRSKISAAISSKRSHESNDLFPYMFAQDFISHYESTTITGKVEVIGMLAKYLGVNQHHIEKSMLTIQKKLEDGFPVSNSDELSSSLVPTYKHLFHDISKQPNGVAFLVKLRKDLLNMQRSSQLAKTQKLKDLDGCLKNYLADWFSDGFLDLQNIKWEDTNASFIEKVMKYEAVHPIDSWNEMKHRMGNRRQVFVFTHRMLPNEPIVVLHTLLGNRVPENIQDVLQTPNDPVEMDSISTATFYSISSGQRGLDGIGLGNVLIKRVVQQLKKDFSHLKTFITLSPLPKFKKWLDFHLLAISKSGTIPKAFKGVSLDTIFMLKEVLSTVNWHLNEELCKQIEIPLKSICVRYLIDEKRRGFAFDPVAHFHLRNGAVLWRLNWLANTSERGIQSSCGIMVNYKYNLDEIKTNNYAYLMNSVIPTSTSVNNVLL